MIGVLLDQGIPRSTAAILRGHGWNVVHVGELGMSRATDRDILAYARSHDRTVVTLDADFHTILAVSNDSTPSVIRIRREGLDGEALAALLCGIWPRIANQVRQGAMVTITERTVRLRRLPLVVDPPADGRSSAT